MKIIVLLGIIAVLVWAAIVMIPDATYAVVKRLRGRTGRILREGPRLILPFIDTVEVVSMELKPQDFEVAFITKDNVGLTVKGLVQYRAEPDIKDAKGLNVYVSVSDESRAKGLRAAAEAVLGNIGGLHNSNEFVGTKELLEIMLRCHLQLENTPHAEEHQQHCLISWYRENWENVLLKIKNKGVGSHSETEERYGVSIASISLAEVKFPADIEDAQKDKQQAILRRDALNVHIGMSADNEEKTTAEKLKLQFPDIGDSERLSATMVMSQEGTTATVTKIEGDAGLGALAAALTAKEKK